MSAECGWLPGGGGRGLASRLALVALVVAAAGCGKDQHALLLTVTATRLVERFDMQVRDLVSGTVLLDRRDEPVTTPARPNRDISDAAQALRLAIEFPARGRYLLRIVGRTAANAEQNQVAVREFVIRGVQRVAVKLIANDHDADRDGFPDCAAYPDCAGLGESLSCDFLDCDDQEQAINRFGLEVCGNQLDDDCSAGCGADPSAGDEPCKDADGDGVPGSQDCNDADPCRAPTIKEDANVCAAGDEAAQALRYALPQACRDKLAAAGATMSPPYCGDGIDQDCNGRDVACVVDGDCDGYPPPIDCDDTRADVNPGAVETCDDNKLDNNCNQVVDEGCLPCDVDGDGRAALGVPRGPSCDLPNDDCDDFDAGVSPGTAESGAGGAEGGTVLGALRRRCAAANEKDGKAARDVDHDCDGKLAADDGCPLAVCDKDGDGFAGAAGGCNPPAARLDCDDNDPETFPGAPDRCGDGKAQDCISDRPARGTAMRTGTWRRPTASTTPRSRAPRRSIPGRSRSAMGATTIAMAWSMRATPTARGG
ncbi:MAG: putative metal-binding motif-containing protein [Proteobacteria bacterium]|nr:putative metal-binding motif-containing protein [Pseudomonadota bacterium]